MKPTVSYSVEQFVRANVWAHDYNTSCRTDSDAARCLAKLRKMLPGKRFRIVKETITTEIIK